MTFLDLVIAISFLCAVAGALLIIVVMVGAWGDDKLK